MEKLKAEGKEVVVKKRKNIVEEHYDDCGDSISSLIDTDLQVRSSSHLSVVDPTPLKLEEVYEDDIDTHQVYAVKLSIDERKNIAERRRIDPSTVQKHQEGTARSEPDPAVVEAAIANAPPS